MMTVILYGALRRRFGREYRYDARTPAEAVQALCSTVPGFRSWLGEHDQPGYKLLSGRRPLGKEDIPTPSGNILRIIPVLCGAKGGGVFEIIAGGLLLAFTVWNPLGWGALALSVTAGIGMSLAMSGVSQMLFSAPKTEASTADTADNKPSYMFSGAVNTISQGNAVPVGYGRLLIGSAVISAGLYAEDISV